MVDRAQGIFGILERKLAELSKKHGWELTNVLPRHFDERIEFLKTKSQYLLIINSVQRQVFFENVTILVSYLVSTIYYY